jgi:hypothetical protein
MSERLNESMGLSPCFSSAFNEIKAAVVPFTCGFSSGDSGEPRISVSSSSESEFERMF